jgi:hypothetical protein
MTMTPAIELGGLTVEAPVTVATNLLLGAQCALYYVRLGRSGAPSARPWALFFLAMAIATLAGAPKHGLRHALSAEAYAGVLWVSGLGSAMSVYWAQRATFAPSRQTSLLTALMALQLTAFVGACLAFRPETWLVVSNTAVGLVPVMLAQLARAMRGDRGSARIAGGLTSSMLTAVVYLTGVSLDPWLDHISISHAMMGAAFALIVRGAAPAGGL